MKILIADDDRVSRRLLEAVLVKLGHQVIVVTEGASALSALLEADAPRLAILDWQMPDLDGLAVCRAVRAQAPEYAYILLLTSMHRQEDRTLAYEAGVDDFLNKPLDVSDLRSRLRVGERVLDLQAKLLQAQAVLRHQATHDHLTGLWNRRMILDTLARALETAIEEQQPIAVALADIDHFKQINDKHGHAAGDAVLRETADRMRAVLRAQDAIGRYGGEEFLLVLPDCDPGAAVSVLERARMGVVGRPVDAGHVSLEVSVSAGVAWASARVESSALVQAADEALYRAKAGGRNRVEGQPVHPSSPGNHLT
ncbi:MAG TPA: diguanylate cyclase [Vicinamibacterales bacterium]|nr:diguanylate cyclase [Vicinamibacterales bacterium]